VHSLVKSVGKPDARNGHVRFDERGRETAGCSYPGTAPFLDSTTIRGPGWFWPLSPDFGMPIRRITRILFSLCSDLETDVIGESVQRGFDADIKLIERRQLLLW
jgi:hypothetical protein